VLSLSFESKEADKLKLSILVKILVELMIDRRLPPDASLISDNKTDWLFTGTQQGDLFLFIAQYVSRGMVEIDQYLTQRMLSFFIGSKDPTTTKERENAVLRLVVYFNKTQFTNQPETPNTLFGDPTDNWDDNEKKRKI